jgi:hypothetical protein
MIPYHLHIEAGSTFLRELIYSDGYIPSLTGYTAKFQVRPSSSSSTLTLETTPAIDVATATITLILTPAQTASLVTGSVYAIELTNGTITTRLSQGQLVVSPEVVR